MDSLRWLSVLVGAAMMTNALAAQALRPFVLPWDDGAAGPTSVAGLEGRPAGQLGPVRTGPDGHLYSGDQRVRLLGVNLCFGGNFPTHAQARAIAERMAKFGINAVRFHHMDMQRFPTGIMLAKGHDSRHLDPRALDRLGYLIAQLARQGVYADINLLVSRQFTRADGLPPEIDALGWKQRHVIAMFDGPMIELQKEYARQLLGFENPYRHRTLATDPAVAIVEINNENGLIQGWLSNELNRLPEVFAAELRSQWNAWLAQRYPTTAALKKAWGGRSEPLGASLLMNADWAQGLRGWVVEQHEQAAAQAAVVMEAGGERALQVNVTRTSSAGWHVQVNQPGLSVHKGELYTVGLEAMADHAGKIGVTMGQAHAPWQPLGLDTSLTVDGTWHKLTVTFEATADDANARLNISGLGMRVGRYEFRNVTLRPGGTMGLEASETIEGGTVPLVEHGGPRLWPKATQCDWVRFLTDTETHYWLTLSDYVKKDLGFKGVVVGTIVGCSTPNIQAHLDAIDSHAYWQHPQFPGRPWDPRNWVVRNVTMVNTPGGVLTGIAAQQVEGKPHLVTEYNHAAPNTFSSEAPLLLAAYAAFQDWDGVFLFAYSHRADDWDAQAMRGFFDIDQHPTKMANMVLAAQMFRRADVAPGRALKVEALAAAAEPELVVSRGHAWNPVNTAGLGRWALLHRVALKLGNAGVPADVPPAPPETRQVYTSDTGQLVWDLSRPQKGVVTVNAPSTRAVIGFVDGREFKLGDVTLRPGRTMQDWCTLGVTLMRGERFDAPGARALIVATGYMQNTDMKWTDSRHDSVGDNWGHAPSLVEVVPGEVELPVPAARVRAFALDEKGQRGAAVPVTERDGHAVVHIGPPAATLWYAVEVK